MTDTARELLERVYEEWDGGFWLSVPTLDAIRTYLSTPTTEEGRTLSTGPEYRRGFNEGYREGLTESPPPSHLEAIRARLDEAEKEWGDFGDPSDRGRADGLAEALLILEGTPQPEFVEAEKKELNNDNLETGDNP